MSLRRTAVEVPADPEVAFDRLLRHDGPLVHVARDPRASLPTAARPVQPRASVAARPVHPRASTGVGGGLFGGFRRSPTPRANPNRPLPTTRDKYGTLEVFPPVETKREFGADDAMHEVFDVVFAGGIKDTDEQKKALIKANADRVKAYFDECIKERFKKQVKNVADLKKKIGVTATWLTVQQQMYEDPKLVPGVFENVIKLVPGEVKQEPEKVLDFKVEPVVLQFRYQTAWLSNMFPTLLTYNVTELEHGASIPTMCREFAKQRARVREVYDARSGEPALKEYHLEVFDRIRDLMRLICATFLLEYTGKVEIPRQDKLLTFLSSEHAFMAQKVNYKALLEAALAAATVYRESTPTLEEARDAERGPNGEPKELEYLNGHYHEVVEAIDKASRALEVFTKIRTSPTAKQAKAIPARRGKYEHEFLKDELLKDDKGKAKDKLDKKGHKIPNPDYVPPFTLVDNKNVWGVISRSVMARAIVKKFSENQDLAELLLHLHGHRLIEGNYFGDTCWGCAMYRMPWVELTPKEAAEGFPDREESQGAMVTTVIKNTNGDSVVVKGCNWLGKALMELSDILFDELDKDREGMPKRLHLSKSAHRVYAARIAGVMVPSPFLSPADQDKNPFRIG